MTATREAIVLPAVFLTVALLGGLRVGDDVRLIAPALSSLVLAMLLVGALARSRVLVPEALMHAGRAPLENTSGAVVLLALFFATAQIFNLLTPERGLLRALFTIFFVVQLLTTLAAVAARAAMLRGLLVLLGAAFVLRFIVLESLYAPGGGLLARVMTAALEGVTLGSLDYDPTSALTGYVGFATLVMYFAGLVLLAPPTGAAVARADATRRLPVVTGLLLIAVLLPSSGCGRQDGAAPQPAASPGTPAAAAPLGTKEIRQAALASARVWRPPAVPISRANLRDNPPGAGSPTGSEVKCRLKLEPVGGTTPKFNCELPGGDVVKIKYGASNPELHAEVAASRLLDALGFGADRMYLVGRVVCAGCPALPFEALKCLAGTGLQAPCFAGGVDYEHQTTFEPAVLERRFPGDRIEAEPDQGWAWYELDQIDAARGGSPPADVDAFRLMAVFLGHWDNKAENQRLVCLPGSRRGDGSCGAAFAIMQDLGATFGPHKLDLRNWRETAVWTDPRSCTVSMARLPYGGATFPERRISDAGRRKLLGLLEQLTGQQVADLFTGSGATTFNHLDAAARNAGEWTAAFLDKVRQIREGGPCG